MSALMHIKNIVIHAMKNESTALKKAVLNVFNEVDNDLDELGYDPSSHVENAIVELNNALAEEDEEKNMKEDIPVRELNPDLMDTEE